MIMTQNDEVTKEIIRLWSNKEHEQALKYCKKILLKYRGKLKISSRKEITQNMILILLDTKDKNNFKSALWWINWLEKLLEEYGEVMFLEDLKEMKKQVMSEKACHIHN